jgi:RNase P subunit RPR2
MMKKDLQELDRRLKELICPVCVERGPKGTCNLSDLEQCPITLHLPGLVEVVRSVHSDQMEDYLEKVRQDICTNCQSALSPVGQCDVRNAGHCALDAYLLLIVQIIDDFLAEKAQAQSA